MTDGSIAPSRTGAKPLPTTKVFTMSNANRRGKSRVPRPLRADQNGRRSTIGAKQKLNAAHIGGALILAALAGAAAESFAVFVVALTVLVTVGLRTGDIRR